MANPVVSMTICTCTFGAVPLPLMAAQTKTMICKMPAATIMDNRFPPFGVCTCLGNPAVAAATAAALGVLTPSACIPTIVGPWMPGAPTVMVEGKPLLNNTSKLMCAFGGVIQVTATPAVTVKTP